MAEEQKNPDVKSNIDANGEEKMHGFFRYRGNTVPVRFQRCFSRRKDYIQICRNGLYDNWLFYDVEVLAVPVFSHQEGRKKMKIKNYKCKCGCNDLFFKEKGSHIGIYC